MGDFKLAPDPGRSGLIPVPASSCVQRDTIAYYDSDPQRYSDATFGSDMSDQRSRFLSYLPEGARILDLGCGSGRDTLAFLEEGFDAVPVDGSEGMCRVAEANTGVPVRRVTFDALDYDSEFDGVWACASLLHVPSGMLAQAMEGVRRALRPGGVAYMSFKKGDFEGFRDGRWYTDMDACGLWDLAESSGFTVERLWVSQDAGRAFPWVSCIVRRARGRWEPPVSGPCASMPADIAI